MVKFTDKTFQKQVEDHFWFACILLQCMKNEPSIFLTRIGLAVVRWSKTFLMKVTYAVLLLLWLRNSHISKQQLNCSLKKKLTSPLLQHSCMDLLPLMMSAFYDLSHMQFPHAPQNRVYNQFWLQKIYNNCFLQ